MFHKLVAIEPIRIDPDHQEKLSSFAETVAFYQDIPQNEREIISRVGDADAMLLSHTSSISKAVLEACSNLRYVGMCCSLYSPESANVDIRAANGLGIEVLGIRDYGDEGVREYAISELARFLHGFGEDMWRTEPTEFTGLPIGVLGMGTTGMLLAEAFRFLGADISYFSRTRKPELEEEKGYTYLPLKKLLPATEILLTCLNKNSILLHKPELELFGNGKIIMNISIGPGHDVAALTDWLNTPCSPGNYIFSDTPNGIDPLGKIINHPHVFCANKSAGMTSLAKWRLGEKVIENIRRFLYGIENSDRPER